MSISARNARPNSSLCARLASRMRRRFARIARGVRREHYQGLPRFRWVRVGYLPPLEAVVAAAGAVRRRVVIRAPGR